MISVRKADGESPYNWRKKSHFQMGWNNRIAGPSTGGSVLSQAERTLDGDWPLVHWEAPFGSSLTAAASHPPFPPLARLFPCGGTEARLQEGLHLLRDAPRGARRLIALLGLAEHRFVAQGHVPAQHGGARSLRSGIQPHTSLGGEAVMANRRARRVEVVAGEDRQPHGGEHGACIRRVVAVVGQRAVPHPRTGHSP